MPSRSIHGYKASANLKIYIYFSEHLAVILLLLAKYAIERERFDFFSLLKADSTILPSKLCVVRGSTSE